MPLQCDPTVIYALTARGGTSTTTVSFDSPTSTYPLQVYRGRSRRAARRSRQLHPTPTSLSSSRNDRFARVCAHRRAQPERAEVSDRVLQTAAPRSLQLLPETSIRDDGRSGRTRRSANPDLRHPPSADVTLPVDRQVDLVAFVHHRLHAPGRWGGSSAYCGAMGNEHDRFEHRHDRSAGGRVVDHSRDQRIAAFTRVTNSSGTFKSINARARGSGSRRRSARDDPAAPAADRRRCSIMRASTSATFRAASTDRVPTQRVASVRIRRS